MAEQQGREGGERPSTGELVDEFVESGKRLAQAEVLRAGEELRARVQESFPAVALLAGAGVLGLGGLIALTLSVVQPLKERPLRAALLGAALLGGAAVMLQAGLRKLPWHPLEEARKGLHSTEAREIH